jgi:large conductance mechanosensitive channel
MWQEFKAFLVKQNVLSLAIAVIVGAALGALVKATVDDFLMPVVNVFTPGGDWKKATLDVGPMKFGVGDWFSAFISFLIVSIVAWRIAKALIKPEPAAAAPATKDCPYCRMKVDALATRCSYCTSALG